MNRVVGNIVIVDSAMGNAFILTSANMPVHLSSMKVNAIEFWSANTTGSCAFSGVDTTNILKVFNWFGNGTSVGIVNPVQSTSFGCEQYFHELKVPVLTAGTAWIYLA